MQKKLQKPPETEKIPEIEMSIIKAEKELKKLKIKSGGLKFKDNHRPRHRVLGEDD